MMVRPDAATTDWTSADRPVSRAAPRRPFFAIIILGLVGALFAPLFADFVAHNAPSPTKGVVSFAKWGPLTKPVELAGEWMLVWHRDSARPTRDERLAVKAPGSWGGARTPDGRRLPANGFATYELTIRDLPPGRYVLYVPIIHGASRVSIDGVVESSMGIVGDSARTTADLTRSQEAPITSVGKPIQVTIDVAAFRELNGGLEGPPVIGLNGPMRTWASLRLSQDFVLRISLVVIAVYGGVVYAFRPADRGPLYLAMSFLCFLPVVLTIGYDNFLAILLPGLDFQSLLAIQYLIGTLSAPLFMTYAVVLFPASKPRVLYMSFILAFAAMFLAQLLLFVKGDVLLVSLVARYDTFLAVASLFYVIFVVSFAAVRGRDGALLFLLGLAAFVGAFLLQALILNDVLTRDQVIGYDLQPLGVLLLLFSHVVILSERWSIATRTAEDMNMDLRRLIDVSSSIISDVHLDSLLKKIVQGTSKFVHADRSSLFLYDDKTHELIASVAEGLETQEVRFDAGLGFAGHSFTSGEIINVVDAYSDPRFNRAVDDLTGYRTKSVLTMPVVARDGRRLGVMQALNRPDPKTSGEADIARMGAFAAQAAIAIDNATLFLEVASARNYNESILRSMSNGVITLDAEGRIAKLNPSGAAILELDPEGVVGMDAQGMLEASNPWMLAELAAVRADNQPRRLLDVDVRTGSGRTISANILVVPLVREGETPAGLLVLIEDISQEKRLEGAMRRFMTQKVVDQVLQRQDELLFGASCQASVLFADVRNFTSMAEALSARETVEMLNELFAEFVESVSASDGVLDKFIGDAVMAVFGVPLPSGRDPVNAVDCATSMMDVLARLNATRRERGQADLSIGVGIATGEVIAGTIGSPKRMDYTVIGDSVNLSSRLQALTKPYKVGIIVCEATAAAIQTGHRVRELDLIRVRGRQKPEKIFQLLSDQTVESFPHFDAVLAAYQRGRSCLLNRDWRGAIAEFDAVLKLNPVDQPSRLMLERATTLLARPPGPDWDGVWSSEDTFAPT
jgi:adenylate cyclase